MQKITLDKIKTTSKASDLTKAIKKWSLTLVLIIVIIFQAAILLYLYIDNKRSDNNSDTLENISKIILLPNERPQIYEINDIATVQKTYGKFFENAQDKDKLILYSDRAIIYREQKHMIINVGPVLQNVKDTEGVSK